MTGPVRIHLGVDHEKNVRAKLEQHGWIVHPWGQGIFTEMSGDEIRQALVQHTPKTYWRWIPDMVAVRGSAVRLVDPKSDFRTDTENFSIEVDAYMAHSAMRGLGLPIVYVWQDMTCDTPAGLRVHNWRLEPERGKNRGSGTPYGLIYKFDQHPFDWAFGPPESPP